jgi:hypothetical protein
LQRLCEHSARCGRAAVSGCMSVSTGAHWSSPCVKGDQGGGEGSAAAFVRQHAHAWHGATPREHSGGLQGDRNIASERERWREERERRERRERERERERQRQRERNERVPGIERSAHKKVRF